MKKKALLFGLGATTLIVMKALLKGKNQTSSSTSHDSSGASKSFSSYRNNFSNTNNASDILSAHLKSDQEAIARQAKVNELYWQKQREEQRRQDQDYADKAYELRRRQTEADNIAAYNRRQQDEAEAIAASNRRRQAEAEAIAADNRRRQADADAIAARNRTQGYY